MTTPALQGQAEADRIALANMSPRYRRLDALERWVTGTQYKGRPNWWDDNVPLWEREPCIVYPVVDIAIQSNTDLCLGEGRFPRFGITHTGKDTAESSGDETSPVETFLGQYHRLSRFGTACREAFSSAQGCGTTVALQGARKGVPFVDLLPAKWCTVELNDEGQPAKLTIEYPYIDEQKDRSGQWVAKAMLFRRVIDEQRDVFYKPAEATEHGGKVDWQEDPAKTVTHGLGFCPVVWYPFMRGCQPVNVIDGKAIHQWVTDEIQAHDIARSQWHRGALMSEPQVFETGVTPGFNPTAEGRAAFVPTTEHGGPVTPDNPITGHFAESAPQTKARKRGPGYVWQYPDGAKVDALFYPGDALKAQQDNCSDLRVKLQEALCVVFLDPENIKFAATTSGKALEAIKQKQLDRCAQYREDFRDGFLTPVIQMQLRLMRKLGDQLKVPGLQEALAALGDTDEFSPADIEVTFGSFFKPDPAEQRVLIELFALAVEKGLLDEEGAIERSAAVFGVQNIDELKKRIEKDRLAREEREVAELKRWSDANGNSGAVPGSPAKPPKGGDSGRPKDGKVNAVAAGQ